MFFIVLIFAAIGIASIFWDFSRSDSLLNRWAASSGLRILECERRYLRRGGFFWTTSKGQVVFYVTVEDREGGVRHAYVRVGGHWLGLLSDRVDVRWD